MDKFELAYTAGYIDGDGCLYMGSYDTPKGTTYEYSVQVCSINPNIITWFKENFGGAIRKKLKRPNQKVIHVWTIKNKECINLVEKIQNFLIAKHRESHFFLEFAYHIEENNYCPLTIDAIKHRETLIYNKRLICHEADHIEKNMITIKWRNIVSQPINRIDTDYAYLAGLIDAEGCFRIKHYHRKNRPNKVFNICLEIGNTNKNFFDWLLFKFGGSISFLKPKYNKKPAAIWSLQANILMKLIPLIIPHLKHKKPIAEKLIEFSNTILPNGGDRHSDTFKKRYTEVLSHREQLVKDIQKLNAKGHYDSSSSL